MALVECDIAVPPQQVFAVLANGWLYSGWVVGTSHMRAVESTWPQAGSRLFHASGLWPAVVRDETRVVEMTTDRRLVMVAKGRAAGSALIEITLTEAPVGTRVVMKETPVGGPGKWLDNPISERILHRRNVEALARLRALSEAPTQPVD